MFLVIDDYNELIYLQTLLKKLGFDVEGLQNQRKYADVSLGFNPHLLLATAKGKKVDGLALAQSVQKRRGLPKILLLTSGGPALSAEDREVSGIDEMLESPINPKKLISAIAKLGDMDEAALLDKYSKIKGMIQPGAPPDERDIQYDENGQPVEKLADTKSAISALGAKFSPSGEAALEAAIEAKLIGSRPSEDSALAALRPSERLQETPARQQRFNKWIDEMGVLPPKSFDRDRIREFNKKIRSAPPPEDIGAIEDERKTFVKALFKK